TVTDDEDDIAKVEFKMPHRTLGTKTITVLADPGQTTFQATFEMDDLRDDGGELEIVATDNYEHESAVRTIEILTTAPPSWWDDKSWVYDQQVSWSGSQARYTFKCWVPDNPRLNYDYPIDAGSLFGTLENHFESDIEVEEHFNIDESPVWWDYSAKGVLNLTVLSQELLDQEYGGSAKEYDGEPVPSYDRNLRYYRMTSPEENLFEFSIEGPSYDYRGIIWAGLIPVSYHAGLSTEVGFEVNLTVGADLRSDLKVNTFRITPVPEFSIEFDMFCEIYEGAAKLGFRSTPTMSVDLPVWYQFGEPGTVGIDPCLQFWVDYTCYGSVAWGALEGDLFSDSYPKPPYEHPGGCAD
ncbi:unnamed protein product, partial [marine sediment metagenome]